MRSRTILAAVLLVGALVPTTLATSGSEAAPERQWAIVNFEHPTKVSTAILMGPYLVVHDGAKMAEGEPCTSIYPVETPRGREEAAVSFHCIPRTRQVVGRFTVATEWDYGLGMYTMTEYQFAGDAEGHGVPLAAAALPRNCLGTGRPPAAGDRWSRWSSSAWTMSAAGSVWHRLRNHARSSGPTTFEH